MTLPEAELPGEPSNSQKLIFKKGMIKNESQTFCKENVRKVQGN